MKEKESEPDLALLCSGHWCLSEAVGNDLALGGRVLTGQPVSPASAFCAALSLCLSLWPGAVFLSGSSLFFRCGPEVCSIEATSLFLMAGSPMFFSYCVLCCLSPQLKLSRFGLALSFLLAYISYITSFLGHFHAYISVIFHSPILSLSPSRSFSPSPSIHKLPQRRVGTSRASAGA